MGDQNRAIGFDRKIDLGWIEMTAACAAMGLSAKEINVLVDEFLKGLIRGEDARRKTKNLLTGIWVRVSRGVQAYRDAGLGLLEEVGGKDRLAIHWGMCIATYPFFWDVISQIGRLSSLQGEMSLEQIRRRIIEKYGDRERVHRSVRHVVQSLRAWDVLRLKKSGIYSVRTPIRLGNPSLEAWLVESYFHAVPGTSIPFNHLTNFSADFPFSLSLGLNDLRLNPRLEVFRQSMDIDFVSLKRCGIFIPE
ncbi:MAG: hypothetical protein UZ16_OP3001000473 [Candidatus Hinthialibacteria bacterium OLB16]|nr:MAG: hypothetical protein UZ16_OP3001000473 [Candidatus Hinthialibacteria bacterium OLB16]